MAGARNGAIAAAAITAIGGIITAVITTRGGGDPKVPSSTSQSAVTSFTLPSIPIPSVSFPIPSEAVATVFLNRDSGPGGTLVLVSGQGFGAGERVVIRFHTDQVGATNATAQGGFSAVAVTIPKSFSVFAPQQFEIVADGASTLRAATAPFTITG